MERLGVHALVRIREASFNNLDAPSLMREAFYNTVKEHNLQAVSEPFIHKFDPQGLTGFILLAESHISIHTWPERGEAALDVFTCGARESSEIAKSFCNFIGCPEFDLSVVYR